MKNIWWWIIGIIVIVLIGWFVYAQTSNTGGTPATTPNATDEAAVRTTVTQFGESLKQVSLLAATSTVDSAMDVNYAAYVDPGLLTSWENDPMHAPGRLTSSPSPDRIDIASVEQNPDGTYAVDGTVVEVTSADASSTVGSGSYPVTLTLSNENGSWLITSFEGYPPQSATS